MIGTGIEKRIQVQQVIESQLPEFILSESPKTVDFLKQYYISQEHRGGVIDLSDNLDQYIKLDNLTPEVIVGVTTLSSGITTASDTITVSSTKGFPNEYGLLRIDDEIISYTGITTNTFTGCIRGFSGITSYTDSNNPGELVFTSSTTDTHTSGVPVNNLSVLFLQEFYKKVKSSLTPGLEDTKFVPQIDVSNFIKESKSLYQSKGTAESFRILFNVLYGVTPKVIDLEDFLIKPSGAEFIRREIVLAEVITGDPNKLLGQTVTKSTDSQTNASISEVEIVTRNRKSYYKLSLFVGYNDRSGINGTFTIPGKSKSIGSVSVGSSVITVDSTVGFGTTGKVISGINTVTYTDKTVNQFLNCTGITSAISTKDDVRADEFIFGYENGDITKKVELRITGVLSNFELLPSDTSSVTTEGELISVKNLGEVVPNPSSKTKKEVFFNSWIYNTACTFQIKQFNNVGQGGADIILSTDSIDKSNLKAGDTVDIIRRGGSQQVEVVGAGVSSILANSQVFLDNVTGFTPLSDVDYDIRRKLDRASSSTSQLQYGNNVITANVQNTYNDSNSQYYVASSSLPSYNIQESVFKSIIPDAIGNDLQGFSNVTQKFSIISFPSSTRFRTGDAVFYKPSNSNLILGGLEEGVYYVEQLTPNNQIKLYASRSFIPVSDNLEFTSGNITVGVATAATQGIGTIKLDSVSGIQIDDTITNGNINNSGISTITAVDSSTNIITISGVTTSLIPAGEKVTISGEHSFVLLRHKNEQIGVQKILKKFPAEANIESGTSTPTDPGSTGILVNGVEITNYKSEDTIYYGPLSNIKILNGGTNFDVINLPNIVIPQAGSGTTALMQPVVQGSLKEILVDQQFFDIERVLSLTISGGNGTGAVLDPVVRKRHRELSFDGRKTSVRGGVDISFDQIIFNRPHNLLNGEALIYDKNDNSPLGIGVSGGSNLDQSKFLSDGSVYYAEVVGISSIKLYDNLNDFNAGTNPVGFTTINTQGTHKFKTLEKKNFLRSVVIQDAGTNYTNRQLQVKPVGISTIENTINFIDHNFLNGEIITYDYEYGGSGVSGISSSNQYKVITLDKDTFRIANAGVGGTNTSDYDRGDYVKFTSSGSGLQKFSYPNVELSVKAVYSPTTFTRDGDLVVTPIVRGSIIDNYLYEEGTNYGSEILNFEKTPRVTVQNGKQAEIKTIASEGRIISIDVRFGGKEYFSPPDIDLVGVGTGVGARFRPVIDTSTGKITEVKIINAGIGYTEAPVVRVKPAGSGQIFEPSVRPLTVNNLERFDDEILLKESETNLQYAVVGYNTSLYSSEFNDPDASTGHSPIVGWAYDGNPIYGPYGYTDPTDSNSSIKLLDTGYDLDTSSVINRPSSFAGGFFVEDHQFNDSGDLDESNGRFTKTPDFPNGTYAYFVGVTTGNQGNLIPKFPYFIGNSYRSNPIPDNFVINQTNFDLNVKGVVRNTLPYKVADPNADNDFITESNEIVEQNAIVESVTNGGVEGFQIIESGSDYKVNESLSFNNTGTSGGGASAFISHVTGKDISSVNTTVQTYRNVVYVRDSDTQVSAFISTCHTFANNDQIVISGLTTSIPKLTNSHTVGVTSEQVVLYKSLGANNTSGIVTDIYVSRIPDRVSAGSSIGIGTEKLLVLNTFKERQILRVKRGVVGTGNTASHALSSPVFTVPQRFTIPLVTDPFESKVNDKVFFNPQEQVGLALTAGTVVALAKSFTTGELSKVISVPAKSIFLPNHPFVNNQQLTFTVPTGAGAISCGTGTTLASAASFNLANGATVFAKRISNDLVGLSTVKTGETIFFKTAPNDNFEYLLESNHTQVTGKAQEVTAHVAVTTSHNLTELDTVDLTLESNLSGGLGISTSVIVKYSTSQDKILINPVNIAQSNIGADTIFLTDHGFTTGEKIYYDGYNNQATGLTTTCYFVYRIDDDSFQLGETRKDIINEPPTVVGITTNSGGLTQTISLVNPPLSIVKNNDLVFYVSDSSLSGYNFNLYYDKDFHNEFVSTGSTSIFAVQKNGTVGVGTTSTVTLKYHADNPINIYYAIEKSGYISTSDSDVKNGSKINYISSDYEGQYTAFGVGTTSFNISLKNVPEKLTYVQSEVDKMTYITNSTTASGGVGRINLASSGIGYKKIPGISSVTSATGINAKILCLSDNINKINKVRILDPGFEYASDKTLKPEARISPTITLINSDIISNIEVVSGGAEYLTAPDVVVVDPETGQLTDQGVIELTLSSSSISEVNIISSPRGLKPVEQKIRTINNSNGVSISRVVGMANTNSVGVVTCTLETPIGGFASAPFAVGDKIFVEGIQLSSSSGTGYNSTDYGYDFFTITDYQNTSPAVLEFNLSGIATAVGVAKISQQNYATVTNSNKYPQFKTTQKSAEFTVGERLGVKESGSFVLSNLSVLENNPDEFIKITGKRELVIGDEIRGDISGTVATINSISNNNGVFNIDYSLKQDRGWNDEIGRLSEDYQVLSDNDYYQNLSYTIQSPITFAEIVDPVNRLVHTSGLKNFADTGITSTAKSGISSVSNIMINRDLISEERVDTINNFDFAEDVDTLNNTSKFLKLQHRKLSSFIECKTNRVLDIDDISSLFSNTDSTQNNRIQLAINDDYESFLVQSKNPTTNEIQIDEVVVFKDSLDTFTFERNNLGIGTQKILDVEGFTDPATSDTFLRITPTDPFDDDLDIKIYRSKFNSPTVGINTQSIGFVNLTGVTKNADPSATISLVSSPIGVTSAFYSTIEVTDNKTNEKNLVDVYTTHDGTNSYFSEYYVDSEGIDNLSSNFIGTFTSNLSGGVLSIDFQNTGINTATIRSKTVGFGLTSVGIGTFRFKNSGEIAGNERSVNLQSNFKRISSTATIVGVDSNKFSTIKSIVKVAAGSTIAIHEVLATHNGTDTSIVHYPFISIGSTSGIGTFISNYANNKFSVRFNPDSGYADVEVSAYSELLYTDLDLFNVPPDLIYGRVTESVSVSQYNAVNGTRANKTSFELKHDGVPIFSKIFTPSNTTQLNAATGEFYIPDHFFNTGEQLQYVPGSTFIGVTADSMETAPGTDLPTDVFAIRVNSDKFKLATSKSNANAGTAVTFTSLGAGNSHKIGMSKKLEKTLIDVDGLIQSPIAFTPVNTTLTNNGGSISASDTIISLAGISSIASEDVLKIGTELLKVTSVGLGTLAIGPISGGGTFKLVTVERGTLGTTAASHNDSTAVRKFKGSYNIIDSNIHFTEPPRGSNFVTKDASGLEFARSDFHGRVYLRNDYTKNRIFDDISDGFTGVGATHIVKVGGANTTGIQTGGSIVLLNGIFQTPTTDNNLGNNYDFIGDTTAGITTITFTGITSTDGNTRVTSEADVNLNQLPRGGMIVSLGSTGGLGIAPLAGAAVTATKNDDGQIQAVGIGTLDRHGSGYRGSVAIGITDIAYEHRFVRSGIGSIKTHPTNSNIFTRTARTASNAVYTSHTGFLEITVASHGLGIGTFVGIDTGGIVFSCSKDHFATEHAYPRSGQTPSSSTGDPIVGVATDIRSVTDDTFTIFVGQGGGGGTGANITATVGAGGTLAFAVAGAGISYTNPQINVPQPTYENLEVIGVSRLGIGATTDTGLGLKVSVNVGASSTVGVGSTLHTVESFKVTRSGFGFKKGDKVRPVGLVTAYGMSTKLSEFELEVTEVFTDNYSSWDFGEFDFIDSIKGLQNGKRTRFPIELNGELLSFESDDPQIIMENLLSIFVNGVLQEPGVSYNFEGGTTFDFEIPPEKDDDISVFFYKGTSLGANADTATKEVAQTLKNGDVIEIGTTNSGVTDVSQTPRTVVGITTSDTFETEIYTGAGIGNTFKPIINWRKQKVDKIIRGEVVSKARDSIEPLIFPTARIIGNLSTSETDNIFVDDAQFFEYEEDNSSLVINSFGALIVNDVNPVAAALTATVSSLGTISAITVVSGGSGYVGSTTSISIGAPLGVAATTAPSVASGIATFATATATITNGSIASVAVNNIGLGYTTTTPPQVLAPSPEAITENLTNIKNVQGFSGIVTGISTAVIGVSTLGLRIGLARTSGNFNTLAVGYPIYIFNTTVGGGVTSLNDSGNDGDIVGIGTLFADNIYIIKELNYTAGAGVCEILTNIHSGTAHAGLTTSVGTTGDRGNFSWGRLYTQGANMSRPNPIAIGVTGNTVGISTGVGISTFPTIERRVYGIRDTGAVKDKLT